jgi:tryptophanyl-tRNA synthetase
MAVATKLRTFSGIQPTGAPHLGNYLGAIKRWVDMQDQFDNIYCVVDLHAMTMAFDPAELRERDRGMFAALFAAGLDPEKAIVFIQSRVSAHAELCWILNCITPLGWLERMTQFKDKSQKQKDGERISAGLLDYPVLMAADILLYQTNLVPVGEDQRQHLEIARDIAIKFNNTYGETFVVPEAEVKEITVPGTDGRKMSKSYGNTISIFSDAKTLKQQVMGIVTDSLPLEVPKNPDESTLFAIYKLFATKEEAAELADHFRRGGVKYSGLKKELISRISAQFEPHRARHEELAEHPEKVREILAYGAEKARKVARPTLEMVRERVGVRY